MYLNKYVNRTEFKVLKQLNDVKLADIGNLCGGSLLVPGIILNSIIPDDRKKLIEWISIRTNHLLLTPSWTKMDVGEILGIKPQVKIDLKSGENENDYVIRTSVKESFFKEDTNIKGIRFRNNTSSALITVTTIPVLDYRYSEAEKSRKEWWDLIYIPEKENEESAKQEIDSSEFINTDDKILLLLVGAGILFESEPAKTIKKYFGVSLKLSNIQKSLNKLQESGLLTNGSITSDGKRWIKMKNLESFQNALIERKEKSNGWDE